MKVEIQNGGEKDTVYEEKNGAGEKEQAHETNTETSNNTSNAGEEEAIKEDDENDENNHGHGTVLVGGGEVGGDHPPSLVTRPAIESCGSEARILNSNIIGESSVDEFELGSLLSGQIGQLNSDPENVWYGDLQ